MKKYLKAVVSGLCAAALALGCVGCGSSARKVMAYEALMRSDMEALRSPATIMKLAQEQGYFLAKPAAVPAKMAPAARKVIAEYSSASKSG